jgi:hypothetical protein
MADDDYAGFARFNTPDPRVGPRESAPMRPEELAWAHERAAVHRTGWLHILLFPLAVGSFLPALVFFLGLTVWQGFSDDFNPDQALSGSIGWLIVTTLLFVGGWALYNGLHGKYSRLKRYWREMPGRGVVELEHHRLLSGISLWSNDYDPDISTISLWIDGRMQVVPDSGVSEWMLARTAAGHWLVLRKNYQGNFSYDKPRLPEPAKRLKASKELSIAFAPGTQLALGQRYCGEPLPLVQTLYWLTRSEEQHLNEIAHHWIFFYPDRYGVVNAQDCEWIEALVARAQLTTQLS